MGDDSPILPNNLRFVGGDLGAPATASVVASGKSADINIALVPKGAGVVIVPAVPISSGAIWSSLTTYSAGQVVFDRGGIWQAMFANTNSEPVSGNPDWTL